MDNKLVKEFLAEQKKLVNATAHATPASKTVIRPENPVQTVDMDNPEEMYNYILEKKPAHKKIIKFLQTCIDTIVSDDD
jgi:hypothetical protein